MTALAGLAGRLALMRGWRRWLLAVICGAVAAAALPPVYALPALLIAFPPLIWLLDGAGDWRRAFALGWCFGLGHFVAGLYWIAHSLLIEPDKFAWMIPLAVLGIPAVLAIYTGVVAVLAWRAPQGSARIVAFCAAWTLIEWLRGQLFTGFPWNALGTVWTVADAPIQFAALGGMFGLGFVAVFAAAAPAALAVRGRARWLVPTLAAGLVAALWAGGAVRLAGAGHGTVPGVVLRLVQPDIPQQLKWRPALRDRHLARYIRLSRQPGPRPVTHLIWPESAVPFLVAEDNARRRIMADAIPPGGLLFTGALRRSFEDGRIRVWNSLLVIDRHARVIAVYDKAHLVPFGEYIPLRGILDFAKVTAGRRDFSAGPGARVLSLPGLPPVRPMICYEAIFPDEVTAPGERPGWLLNVTNDAWFGVTSGPYQHFAAARLRAVEQGVPLIRAANTGISGVVDPYGRVLQRLGLNRVGVIDTALPTALAVPTFYSRTGDRVVLFFVIILLFGAVLAKSFQHRP